ncbi:pyrBI operon leader peptide [Dryocola sp. BD613]
MVQRVEKIATPRRLKDDATPFSFRCFNQFQRPLVEGPFFCPTPENRR